MSSGQNKSFEELYTEYGDLRARTTMVAHIHEPGQVYPVNQIDWKDLERRKELALILIEKYAIQIPDAAELFELSNESEEHCTCGHQIYIHGSLIAQPIDEERMTHDGPCLVSSCSCKQYKIQK